MGTSLPKEINQYEVKEEENRIIIKTKKCKCIYEVKGRNFHKDKLEVTYTYGKKRKYGIVPRNILRKFLKFQ